MPERFPLLSKRALRVAAGGVLIFALSAPIARAQTSPVLAWDSSQPATISGFAVTVDGVRTDYGATPKAADGTCGCQVPAAFIGARHVVVVSAYNGAGETPSVQLIVGPTANAGGPYSGRAGTALSVTAAASTDVTSTITSYTWRWGDGTPNTSGPSAAASHTFATAGTYTVTLTVTDGDGATSSSTASATISSGAPGAPTSPSPASGATGIATTAALTWTASGATSYTVKFGTTNPPSQVAAGLTAATYAPSNLVGGTTYYWQIVAVNTAGSTTGPVWTFTTAGSPGAKPTDINGDGHPDLLWQSQATGALAAWFLNGTGVVGTTMVNPSGVGDPQWRVVGMADFNNDGHPDLVWHHDVTGQVAVWYMQGATMTAVAAVSPNGVANPQWTIVGVADFDKDGKPDLLWRNTATGQLAVWFMNGVTMRSVGVLNPDSVADLQWEVAAVADFNRDGWPDLLWRNAATGATGIWYMQGVNLASAGMLNPSGVADVQWTIAGVADFNGDGNLDILWTNEVTGATGVWLLSGTALQSVQMLSPTSIVDPVWKVVGIR